MSYQAKRAIVSLSSTLLVSAIYLLLVLQEYAGRDLSTADELTFWAAVILLMVPVQVIAKILFFILFIIVNVILTQEEEPPFTDEMDRLIELKSTRNLSLAFIAGFFLSMVALLLEQPMSAMFIGFLISFVVAGIIDDLSQLYYYQRGI